MLPRPQRHILGRFPASLALAVSLMVLAGCGGTELEVEPAFDGKWSVAGVTVNGAEVDVTGADLKIEIDTAEAALRGTAGCGRILGSYTLESSDEAEGDASVTIPSPAPSESCPAPDRERHESLVAALESVTRWRQEPSSLLLLGPESTAVELRPAG